MTTRQITLVYEFEVLTVCVHSTVHSCRQCSVTEMHRPWIRVFPYISQRDMYPCHSEFHIYFYLSADLWLKRVISFPAIYLVITFATAKICSSSPTFWGWPWYNAIVPRLASTASSLLLVLIASETCVTPAETHFLLHIFIHISLTSPLFWLTCHPILCTFLPHFSHLLPLQ